VHVLRSVEDALALRAASRRARRVAIVGAGFVGSEVAATLRSLGVAVTLIDVAPRPLMPLGALAGEAVARMHAERGVTLRLGRRVAGVARERVLLAGGERIDADVVLVALGAAPCTDWLEGSGLTLRDGVVVDAFGFADEARRIVAAGDVAVGPHPLAGGEPVAIRHWSNAAERAPIVAGNLLAGADGGECVARAPVPSVWSDQYEVKIQAAGFPHLADRETLADEDARRLALAWRGDRLVGAVGFNRARDVARLRRELAAPAVPSP